jgi:undecaprenyl-diphosphatase
MDIMRERSHILAATEKVPERSEHTMEDHPRQATEVVESALGSVQSEQDAHRVLAELERRTAQKTEQDVRRAAAAARPSPERLRERLARARGPEKAVQALEVAVEETASEDADGGWDLSDAIHRAMTWPRPEQIFPHEYLRRAVLKRMGPFRAVDAWLFFVINRFHHPRVTPVMVWASTLGLHGAAWVVGALGVAARDGRRGRAAAMEMIPALLVTNTIVERVVKGYFRRRRPFITLVRAMVIGRKPGSWSFPSGHSACSFACASALAGRYKRAAGVFYGLASLVGFSRVYLGHHYPMDVLSGATLGTVLSRLVVQGVRRLRRR